MKNFSLLGSTTLSVPSAITTAGMPVVGRNSRVRPAVAFSMNSMFELCANVESSVVGAASHDASGASAASVAARSQAERSIVERGAGTAGPFPAPCWHT